MSLYKQFTMEEVKVLQELTQFKKHTNQINFSPRFIKEKYGISPDKGFYQFIRRYYEGDNLKAVLELLAPLEEWQWGTHKDKTIFISKKQNVTVLFHEITKSFILSTIYSNGKLKLNNTYYTIDTFNTAITEYTFDEE